MNNKKIITKGTNMLYKLVTFLAGGVFLIIGTFFVVNIPYYHTFENNFTEFIPVLVAFVFGIISIIISFVHCSSYVIIYNGTMQGKGILGRSLTSFNFNISEIKSITIEPFLLCIHTEIGVIKIVCRKEYKAQILDYFKTCIKQ